MDVTRIKGDVSLTGLSRTADRSISFEVCTDIEAFRALQLEWDDLYRRANGEYFQSFEYCHGSFMAEHILTERKLHCVVGRRHGRLVAVWPLLTSYRGYWRFAEPLTPRNQSPSDMLIAPEADAAEIVEAAWRAAVKLTRADVFELWRVRKTSPLRVTLDAKGLTRRAMEEFTPVSALRHEQDWDAYCRSRPARERNAPEYLKRRLAKQGDFSIEPVDATDARLPALIDWFVVQKRKWAEEKSTLSEWTFSDASHNTWNTLLDSDSNTSGTFRFFVLLFKGQPIAANILAVSHDTAYLVANTYDLNHRRFSPGTILVDECVKWAFEHRLDFDFGSGEQRYKTSWSAGEKYATSSFMVLATPWGHAGYMSKQGMKKMRALASRIVGGISQKLGIPAVP